MSEEIKKAFEESKKAFVQSLQDWLEEAKALESTYEGDGNGDCHAGEALLSVIRMFSTQLYEYKSEGVTMVGHRLDATVQTISRLHSDCALPTTPEFSKLYRKLKKIDITGTYQKLSFLRVEDD